MSELGLQNEIAALEKQLQEKKAALEHEQPEAMPSEHEMVKEAIGERIQQHAPSYQPAQTGQPQPAPSQPAQIVEPPSYLNPELKDKVQELVNLVFERGLDEAIKAAVETDNPSLMDAFHDVISDQLYKTMVERKTIQEPK